MFYARFIQDRRNDGIRYAVSDIRAARVRFDYNTAAQKGLIRRVGFFGMVGVYGVRVVHRNEKGRGKRFVKFVVVKTQGVRNPF